MSRWRRFVSGAPPQIRTSGQRSAPFGQVTVQPYYAVHQKNGKTEYDFAPTEVDICIHAVFPHLGYNPCWYANRHRDVIHRFGRFPHRNAVLRRVSTPDEEAYLAEPGAGF